MKTALRLANPATRLILSTSLVWFSENFPFYTIFEPQSTGWILWVSYAKDLIQPFAFYIFLGLGEKWLKTWQIRAALAFAIPTLLEIGQIFLRVLIYRDQLLYMGSFDALDIVMYALGVGLAVLAEQFVLKKLLKSS